MAKMKTVTKWDLDAWNTFKELKEENTLLRERLKAAEDLAQWSVEPDMPAAKTLYKHNLEKYRSLKDKQKEGWSEKQEK